MPDTRLADAFAIYGVPRNITQYMRLRKVHATPRAHMTGMLHTTGTVLWPAAEHPYRLFSSLHSCIWMFLLGHVHVICGIGG